MSKEEVLSLYPNIPEGIHLEAILAHDQLFQDDLCDPILYPPGDPELTRANRTYLLVLLNRLGTQIKNRQEKVEFYQELSACELWTALEFGKVLKSLPPGPERQKLEQIMIDRKVHQMDPDFSFSREMWNEPMPSLLDRKRPK
jgi:hypothetical protein